MVSSTTDAVKVNSANTLIFLFRNFPQVSRRRKSTSRYFLFLVWIGAVLRCARTARAHEYLAAIRECHVAAVGFAGRAATRVLGSITADDDYLAGLQRVAREPFAQQRVGRASLDHPLLSNAVGNHVHMNPGMRIDPLHSGDFALQHDG